MPYISCSLPPLHACCQDASTAAAAGRLSVLAEAGDGDNTASALCTKVILRAAAQLPSVLANTT